jgi:TP901 family phage tail tape measure protein
MPNTVTYILLLKDKMTAGLTRATAASNRLTKSTTKTSGAMGGLTASLGGMLPLLGAAGVIGAVTGIVSEFANFEKSMSKVKAVTGATGADFQAMEDQAKQLGKTTAFTAGQAADAMGFLGMAGFQTQEIMSAMPSVLDLAAAGNMDLARTADIASNIMTGMGLTAEDMTRIADVLATTAARANVDIGQLGEAFKFAAPAASRLGVTLEETSAILGLLGDMGIQGTLAGTAFRNFGQNVAKLDDSKLATLGLTMKDISDERGNMLPIGEVFGLLMSQAKKLGGNLEQTAVLTKLLGIRGAPALDAFGKAFKSSDKNFDAFVKKLKESSGAAGKMAKTMLDNLSGDFTILKSAVSGVAISIGEKLAPVLRFLTKGFTTLIGKLPSLLEPIKGLLEETSALTVSLKEVTKEMSIGGAETSKFGGFVSRLWEKFSLLDTMLFGLKATMKLLLAPVFAIVKGFQALINIGGLVIKFFQVGFTEGFGKAFSLVLEKLKMWGKKIADFFVGLGVGIKDVIVGIVTFDTGQLERGLFRMKSAFGGVAGELDNVNRSMAVISGNFDEFQKSFEKTKIFKKGIERKGAGEAITGGLIGTTKELVNASKAMGVVEGDFDVLQKKAKAKKIGTGFLDLAGIVGGVTQAEGAAGADLAGITPPTTDAILKEQKQQIIASAPKQFIVNIDKLVETFNVNTTTVGESITKIKELIEQALVESTNDIVLRSA